MGTTENLHLRIKNVFLYCRLWRNIKGPASRIRGSLRSPKAMVESQFIRRETVHGEESTRNQGEKTSDLFQYLPKASLDSISVTLKLAELIRKIQNSSHCPHTPCSHSPNTISALRSFCCWYQHFLSSVCVRMDGWMDVFCFLCDIFYIPNNVKRYFFREYLFSSYEPIYHINKYMLYV